LWANGGLTIHSSRTRFVPAKGGTEKRATFCLHYAGRLNSGVMRHSLQGFRK
jgi:hypothetical protein